MKLELPLLKAKRKNMVLEEENTVDFVFIPPEAKARVLTEHQKEVLRTKRFATFLLPPDSSCIPFQVLKEPEYALSFQ